MKFLSLMRTSSGVDEFPLYRSLLSTDPDLVNFDDRNYGFHEAPSFIDRALRTLSRNALIEQFNADIQRSLRALRPDFFIAFKAPHLLPETVSQAKKLGAKCILVYPDLDPTIHGASYLDAIRLVDIFYYTKPNHINFFKKNIRQDAKLILPFYSNIECAKIEQADPALGVSFVGHFSQGKRRDLEIFRARIQANMTIIGSGWGGFDKAIEPRFNTSILEPIYGKAIRDIYRKSICSLGLLMESINNGLSGDEITSRSVLIPASGGVIIHPKNESSKALFGADCLGLFENLDEATELILEISQNTSLRKSISMAQQTQIVRNATCAEDFIARLTK